MKRVSWMLLLLILLTFGCRQEEPMAVENAVYYWRTGWQLDSTELAFLKQYNIQKVYCRYFDVMMADSEPMPNARRISGTVLMIHVSLVC